MREFLSLCGSEVTCRKIKQLELGSRGGAHAHAMHAVSHSWRRQRAVKVRVRGPI